jgi:hypothetical protein
LATCKRLIVQLIASQPGASALMCKTPHEIVEIGAKQRQFLAMVEQQPRLARPGTNGRARNFSYRLHPCNPLDQAANVNAAAWTATSEHLPQEGPQA